MKTALAESLLKENLITQNEREKIEADRPLSLHWDLRSILYLGILLATTAVGILIYKNIDTIGHDVMLVIIAISTIACFAYCWKKSVGYRNTKIDSAQIWPDYVLLTGCLLLLTLIAYAQFQYNFFGNRWGLALFIPMVLLFIAAYYFDHLGVLSLAITNLAAWAGITITPTRILQQNDFSEERIMFIGLLLGAFLIAISIFSKYKNVKAHFSFTYKNFGIHVLFISLLAILFYYENLYLLNILWLAGAAFLMYQEAMKERSSYFLVFTLLYFYVGISYFFVRLMLFDDMAAVYGIILYFIISGIGLIVVFQKLQKKIKTA